MKLQFIGTGSGKTSLKRAHSSILISSGKSNTLVDCGDGTSRALLKNNVDYNSIDSIIFTHYHPDHFSGIASLIAQMKLNKRKSELTIYTSKNLLEPLKQFLITSYLFMEAINFDIHFIEYDFDSEYRVKENFSFLAKQNSHIHNRYNVKIVSPERFVSASLLLKINEEQIIYTSDISSMEDLFLFDNQNPKIFITETTHIDLDWIHGIINLYHPEKIYLTHISDEDESRIKKYLQNQDFPNSAKVSMAEDGHSVTLF